MAFTYGGDPSASTTAAIRFKIGDVDSTDPLLQDAEIAYAYSQGGSVLAGALIAARAAAAKLARSVDRDLDGLSTKKSQRHAQMLDVVSQLEAEIVSSNFTFTAPDTSSSVADAANYPTDLEHSDLAPPSWDAEEE